MLPESSKLNKLSKTLAVRPEVNRVDNLKTFPENSRVENVSFRTFGIQALYNFQKPSASFVLGGSWYLLAENNCTYNPNPPRPWAVGVWVAQSRDFSPLSLPYLPPAHGLGCLVTEAQAEAGRVALKLQAY